MDDLFLPIEKTDANTRAVFGDYISIYDIQRAVADKATVPIYYESRVAKLGQETKIGYAVFREHFQRRFRKTRRYNSKICKGS